MNGRYIVTHCTLSAFQLFCMFETFLSKMNAGVGGRGGKELGEVKSVR